MENMQNNIYFEFSQRLNQVADLLKVPPVGKNRQSVMGKMFGVSQEAARKWLSGEGMPQLTKCIEICNKANISIDWLLTGKGSMLIVGYNLSNEMTAHLQVMQQLPDYARTEVIRDAIKTAELITKAQAATKANGTQ